MVHVIAFDVSMGKSTMVIYNSSQCCIYEGELEHTAEGFAWLKERIEVVIKKRRVKNQKLCLKQLVCIRWGLNAFYKKKTIPILD